MTQEFRTLRDDEIEILLNSPAMVSVLIAGADEVIDDHEVAAAKKYAEKKGATDNDSLNEYFQAVAEKFDQTLSDYIKDLPTETTIRQDAISSYLRQLNGILPKIDKEIAIAFHASLLEISQVVAKASGGVLGFNKVSKEEDEYVTLDMIQNPAEFKY